MNLTYQLLKSEIDKLPSRLCNKLKATDDGKKFALLMLKKISGKKDSELDTFYTDGSGDHQIDSVYFIEDSDSLKVFILTNKFFSKLTDQIPDKDVSDFLNNGVTYLISGEEKVGDLNSKIKLLKEDIDEERKNYEDKIEFNLLFISSSKQVLSHNGRDAVEKYISDVQKSGVLISYQEINSDKLSSIFANRTILNYSIPIKLSGKSYYQLVGREGFICRLPVREIIKIYKGFSENGRTYQGYFDYLFTDNVRKDLGLEKRINQKIYDTATNPNVASDFEYYNNGLTVIYENKTGQLMGDSPVIYLTGLQVVNGCQTVSTLVKADNDGKLLDDIYVTTKFIKRTEDTSFIQSVINYTNTQNAITDRDLHSNDQIQYDIQGILKGLGYLYERKLNEFKEEDSDSRIDALEAAQAYLCCELAEPHTAKQKKRKLFNELYDRIFDSSKGDLAYKLLLSYKTLEYSSRKRAENRNKKTKTKKKGKTPRYRFGDLIIAHGTFHIASLLYKRYFSKKSITELKKAINIYDRYVEKFDKHYPKLTERIENKLKKKGINRYDLAKHFKLNGISGL